MWPTLFQATRQIKGTIQHALSMCQEKGSGYARLNVHIRKHVLEYYYMQMIYRTRSKFRGLNFRVAPSNCIRGSLSSWSTNFRGRAHTSYSKMLSDITHVFALFDSSFNDFQLHPCY